MGKNLSDLIEFVGKHVVFNAEHYPELKDASEKEKFIFAIRHSALHFSKTAGKIAVVAEDVDHGSEPDIAKLKEQVWKSLVNAFWLADKIDMTEEEIISSMEKKYSDK